MSEISPQNHNIGDNPVIRKVAGVAAIAGGLVLGWRYGWEPIQAQGVSAGALAAVALELGGFASILTLPNETE